MPPVRSPSETTGSASSSASTAQLVFTTETAMGTVSPDRQLEQRSPQPPSSRCLLSSQPPRAASPDRRRCPAMQSALFENPVGGSLRPVKPGNSCRDAGCFAAA